MRVSETSEQTCWSRQYVDNLISALFLQLYSSDLIYMCNMTMINYAVVEHTHLDLFINLGISIHFIDSSVHFVLLS